MADRDPRTGRKVSSSSHPSNLPMFEQLEPRLLLSASLPGLHLVDPTVDRFDGQVIYLDFDGENDVTYNGPVTVEGIDVPIFSAPGELAGQEQAIISQVLSQLDDTFAETGLTFTLTVPDTNLNYSTIHVGGNDAPFADYGSFLGLAEQVDVGNQNPSDNAFVFSAILGEAEGGLDQYVSELTGVIAHETGRLLGYASNSLSADPGPLEAVAATYYSAYGTSRTRNLTVQPGRHYFQVDGIASYKNTEWYVNGFYTGSGENDWSGILAIDPEYDYSFSSGTTQIKALVYDRNWNYEGYHTWNATVAKPDLIVQDISVSSSRVAGQSATITATLKNQGNADANGSVQLKYYVDGSYIGSDNLSWGLDAGDSNTESISYTASSSGSHSIRVYVDSSFIVSESNESNNNRTESFTWSSPPKPDLIVQNISISPSSPTAGQSATITATLKNQGNAKANGSIRLKYYVDGSYIGDDYLSFGLGVGSSNNESISYTYAGSSGGNHTVKVIVDTGNIVSESNESNNDRSETYYWNPVPKPDLDVLSITGTQSSYYIGDKINAQASVRNIGNATADNSLLDWYLGTSSNQKYRSIEANAWLGGIYPFNDMSPNEVDTDAINLGWTIPDNVAVGTYYVYAFAETDGDDSNPSNDWARSGSFVIGKRRPDLDMLSVTGTQSSYYIGDKINAEATVKNLGNATADNSLLDWYLGTSSNQKYRSIEANAWLGGIYPFNDMSPNEVDTDVINWGGWTIPDNVAVGTYYVYAFAETDGDDSNPSNDWARSTSFSISRKYPDLDVLSVTGTQPSYYIGDKINAEATVKNLGKKTAEESTIDWYLGTSTNNKLHDIELNSWLGEELLSPDNNMSPDEVDTDVINFGWTIPENVAVGTYSVYAFVETETDELVTINNEGHSDSFEISRKYPDLDVLSVTGTQPSYYFGDKIHAEAMVENLGKKTAEESTIDWYLGTSTNKKLHEIELNSWLGEWVPIIDPDNNMSPGEVDTDVINFGWTIPENVAVGTYSVYAFVETETDELVTVNNEGHSASFEIRHEPEIVSAYWEDADGNPIPSGKSVLDKSDVYLAVEASWFETGTVFSASVYEAEVGFDDLVTGPLISLTNVGGNKWRGSWHATWDNDGLFRGDQEFYFKLTDYPSFKSDEIHVEQRRAWATEAGWSDGTDTVNVANPTVDGVTIVNDWFASGINLAQLAFQWTTDNIIGPVGDVIARFTGPGSMELSKSVTFDSSVSDYSISFGRGDFGNLVTRHGEVPIQAGLWNMTLDGLSAGAEIVFDSFSVIATYFTELVTHENKLEKETSAGNKNAVVLIHGWDSGMSETEPYVFEDRFNTDEWLVMETQLLSWRQNNPDWDILEYSWDEDSATGGVFEIEFVENAIASRHVGTAHGAELGLMLADTYGNSLENVQFLAHSAGNWVAREAIRYLKDTVNTTANIQLTSLDPFVPDNPDLAAPDGLQDNFEELNKYRGDNVFLENYYVIDPGTDAVYWTSGGFKGWHINLRLDREDDGIPLNGTVPAYPWILDNHGTPTEWYAKTVEWANEGRGEELKFKNVPVGFANSLMYTNELGTVNESPTDILLSNATVPEHAPAGTLIGELTTTDPDVGDTHVYSLEDGWGDNDLFVIDGNQLKTGEAFAASEESIYNVRIRTADGNRGGTYDESFEIQTIPVNDMPVADAVEVEADEDTAVVITLAGSDIETPDGQLIYKVASDPQHGMVTINGNQATYTPGANYNGPDSFTFTVTDNGDPAESHSNPGDLTSIAATVTITVKPVNDRPIADAQSVTTGEDKAKVITLSGSDFETPDGQLVYKVASAPQHGTVTINGDQATYTPTDHYNGPDSFSFTVTDTADGSSIALSSSPADVSITVNPVNDRPIADAQTIDAEEDTAKVITLTSRDIETPAGQLIYKVASDPQHGTVTINGNQATYTPAANYNGPDSFKFTVTDTGDGSSSALTSIAATVSITVNPVNDMPVADIQSMTTDEDTAKVITLSGSDLETPDGQLVYKVASDPQHGTVTINGNQATYTPEANYNGPDSFAFTVTDAGDPNGGNQGWGYDLPLTSIAASVSITVNPVNDRPVGQDDDFFAPRDDQIDVVLVGVDVETANLDFTIINGPANGTLTPNGPGSPGKYTYNPNVGSIRDSFTYTVTDNGDPAGSHANQGDLTSEVYTISLINGYEVNLDYKGRYQYNDADGDLVTITLKKGGTGTLLFPNNPFFENCDLISLSLSGTNAKSYLTFKTKRAGNGDGLTTVGEITGSTPLRKLSGKKIDLIGDGIVLTGSGYIGLIYLHDLTNGADIIMAGTDAPKGIYIKAGQLSDGTDITLGSYLRSLTATDWVGGSLTTPWASRITMKGYRRNGIAGDLGVDLTFTGSNPKNGVALYKLSVAGTITDSDIQANFGSVGYISAGQWSAGSLNATWVKTIMTKGKKADRYGNPAIAGDFGAAIVLFDQDSRGISLNKLQVAGEILDTQISLSGGAGSIKAAQWEAGSLNADWLKTVTIKGKRGILDGDFGANLTLSGSNAPKGYAFKTIKIAGEASGIWAVTGNGSTVQLGASTADWTATFNGSGNVKYLKVKGYKDKDGNKVQGDLSGSWTGNSVRSVSVYGNLNNAKMTLNQTPDPKNLALRYLTVKGWIGDDSLGTQTWILTNGNIGSIKAGGIRNSSIIAANNAAGYSQDVQSPLGGIAGDGVLDLLDASELVGDSTRIKSLKITGIKGQSGKFVINSTIAATEFGTVSLRFLDTINGSPFGISADYIGKLTIKDDIGTDTWKWLETASDSIVLDDAEIRLV